jgi:hypothetical protein
MSTYESVASKKFFNKCLDLLTTELVKEDLDVEAHQQQLGSYETIDEEQIRKSVWVASVLASSDEEEHQRKALAFGILSYLKYREGENQKVYERYLYIILSRLGNLPAFENVNPVETPSSYEEQLLNL